MASEEVEQRFSAECFVSPQAEVRLRVARDLDMFTVVLLMNGFHRFDILTITSGQWNAWHLARATLGVVEKDEVIQGECNHWAANMNGLRLVALGTGAGVPGRIPALVRSVLRGLRESR